MRIIKWWKDKENIDKAFICLWVAVISLMISSLVQVYKIVSTWF